MEQRKKVLIIGGGIDQVGMIRRCRERGYETWVLDYNPDIQESELRDVAALRKHAERLLTCPVYMAVWVGTVVGLLGGVGWASPLVGVGAAWLNAAFNMRGAPAVGPRRDREAAADAGRGCTSCGTKNTQGGA